ncbi:NmrA family NAD(P)-binding protein [Actinomadura rugatobispora]|uniref:NmrA family NAD(P)-binding protein n=1 Tax=Actinomadura rugatobispora TaxID=1994 RepID=A0ABW1A2I5_9ACTN|nr:NmrA/HSCARG family protein [Actinomadura rugatobispora]
MSDIYLVIGAGGAQGGAVARRLLRDGHRVRGLGRSVRGPSGVEWVRGDLADAAAVRAAFEGVTRASVTLPMEFDPAAVARFVDNIVAASADLERLVFNTGNRVPAVRTGVAAFESKRAAAEALLACGVPAVVLRPPVYLDNLAAPWAREALAGGVLPYPLPAAHRVAWLAHDDLGALTAAAFDRPALAGAAVDIGGKEAVTGPELAAAFTSVLGREIRYVPVDPDAFEEGLVPLLGAEAAAGVASTYRWLAAPEAAGLYEGDPAKLEALFGVELTPLRTWIGRNAA